MNRMDSRRWDRFSNVIQKSAPDWRTALAVNAPRTVYPAASRGIQGQAVSLLDISNGDHTEFPIRHQCSLVV